MGETEEFNPLTFEKKLMHLKDTQDNIQSLSTWCLKQRVHHKRIVQSWLSVLKRVKVEQKLVLFYLANDVIQYSKRKNYEFVESWGLNLQKATPLVRDEKIRHKILRIFKIWEERSVYDEEFLSDLTGLLQAGATKKTDDDAIDFQPQQLVNKIKQCSVLEADTDLRLKYIHESHLQLSDADALRASLKDILKQTDKSNKDDVEKDLNEGIGCVERYTQALQREIVAREALLALLAAAVQYYSTQRGEVKVVAYAYKNFGARVRALKRKLDDLIPTLPNAAPSPPQRDEDVPSPGPDEDLDLPAPDNGDDSVSYNIDKTFNTSLSADGSLYNLGLSSFLTSDNPLVIFNDTNVNMTSNTSSQKSQDTLPGLDLLTPESTGNPPPPTSFYGSMDNSINDEPDQSYRPESINQWNNGSWSMPPVCLPPPPAPVSTNAATVFSDTPESPPHMPIIVPPPEPKVYTQEIPPADVDHRGILPPLPPPPMLTILGVMEDVDHRLLSLPPMPPLNTPPPVRHPVSQQDVDHRNLISLTQQLPSPRSITAITVDQDYRVPPPMVPPPDIVESVDMDLSEDEEQRMYSNQQSADRRPSFNNNKVLVGGDNGKTNHNDQIHTNLIRINSNPEYEAEKMDIPAPPTAPILPPLINPFENMPPSLKQFNTSFDPRLSDERKQFNPQYDPRLANEGKQFNPPYDPRLADEVKQFNPPYDPRLAEEKTPIEHYEEDTSRRLVENIPMERNPSPPDSFDLTQDVDFDFQSPPPRLNQPFLNQRYPRNWTPRTFRHQGWPGPQFWPRNVPPRPRWAGGPRPQRFW